MNQLILTSNHVVASHLQEAVGCAGIGTGGRRICKHHRVLHMPPGAAVPERCPRPRHVSRRTAVTGKANPFVVVIAVRPWVFVVHCIFKRRVDVEINMKLVPFVRPRTKQVPFVVKRSWSIFPFEVDVFVRGWAVLTLPSDDVVRAGLDGTVKPVVEGNVAVVRSSRVERLPQ